MKIASQLLIIVLYYPIVADYIRSLIIYYLRNQDDVNKYAEYQDFKDKLLFRKFKDKIPAMLRDIYYAVIISNPLVAVVCLALYFAGAPDLFGSLIVKMIFRFDSIALILLIEKFRESNDSIRSVNIKRKISDFSLFLRIFIIFINDWFTFARSKENYVEYKGVVFYREELVWAETLAVILCIAFFEIISPIIKNFQAHTAGLFILADFFVSAAIASLVLTVVTKYAYENRNSK